MIFIVFVWVGIEFECIFLLYVLIYVFFVFVFFKMKVESVEMWWECERMGMKILIIRVGIVVCFFYM